MNPAHELPKIDFKKDKDIISLADSSIYNIYDRAVEYFPSGSIFVELGVFNGGSCLYLADKIQKSGKDIKIYAIDIWENVLPERKIDGVVYINIDGNIFYQFWNNVMKYEFDQIIRPICFDSALAARMFDKVDFVFVDGDHSYQGCYNDIMAWKDKCKWIAGHDYNQEVWKVVNDLFNESEIENVQNMSFLVKRE